LNNAEKKTTSSAADSNFPTHATILPITHTNPYLDLILKEVMYVVRRHKEIESNKHNIVIRRFNSVLFGNHDNEYAKKELHKTLVFMKCLTDLIANKPEIIGYMVGEMCESKIMESSEDSILYSNWKWLLSSALGWSIQPFVKLFDPQSTQITFLTESCYELSKKSIYDLKNVITKFILGKEKKYTLNDLHLIYIDGIEEFLGIYSYPLEDILTKIFKEYWTYKLPKLINGKTNILKVTPEISKFTEKVLQFYKNFYKKINKEFENFERKGVNEKNNIVPFIYYYLCMTIIKSLISTIKVIYNTLFGNDKFTNWHTFAKFFIYPFYEIYDDFCKKLIIDKNNNKFKLYKYFSNCNNKRLINSIWSYGELSCSSIYFNCNYMYVPVLEKQDQEWVYIKNKLLQNRNIIEEWVDHFKKFQS